ncbi:LIM domain only protein 7-like isoform X3 [Etheostoma cragini]|uniref:LIM domain only protein 7-like isoform X3 n=1 Tax=Etheostoma cragini TaxID=417921 RepID=UPI00155F49F4|nr:LIM domain only protein 7-like isoform X3 [Etheostoma cragini]
MEWRQQTSVSCADAFNEAQRWIEEVTGKSFGCKDFRAALENGVLLCDLINQLKPGIIKRVNRLSTPIAGLDNVNVFLKACGKLGLNVSQLFHPGDLQDLSTRATVRQDETNRRLKNVLITIYWLGRKAHLDTFYSGPQLNFKAFEGLLGLALSKALDEGSNVKECWDPEREECQRIRPSYKMATSADGIDFLYSRGVLSNNESCGSDAEAEQVFKMEPTQPSTQQNKAYIPAPLLRRKQGWKENERDCASSLARAYQMQVRPERPVQVNPGWIWSKSLSDIPMVYPVRKVPDVNTIYDVDQENQQRCSVAAKDSEAQWQDDLSKWKNRRRSSKSDLRRKSQEREHVTNQMANGALAKFEKKEVNEGGLLKRDQQSPRRHYPAPLPYSTSPSAKSLSSDLRPRTRALLARNYATEASFSPMAPLSLHNSSNTQGSSVGAMPTSDGIVLSDETYFASLASDGTGVTTPSLDCPFSSQTQGQGQGSPAHFQPRDPTEAILSQKELPFCHDPNDPKFCIGAVNQARAHALEDLHHQNYKSKEESQKTSWEPAVEQGSDQQAAEGLLVHKHLFRTASWSGSASLPRGYRRSEGSSRLSSAITARPFGNKQSRVSSLPRLCNVDNQGLLKSEELLSPNIKSSLKRPTVTTHQKGQQKKANQTKQNGREQGEKVQGATVSGPTSFQTNGYHHQPYTQTQIIPQPYSNLQTHHNKSSTVPSDASIDLPKVDHSDMRVSLALKPNSRTDFGFQTHWDSTGARVKFIEPGSPAELCQLCVGDEIVTVNGVAVAHMNYNQWKDKMTSCLQTGSLTMDMRRYGNKDWSISEGSHPNQSGQSRVTLNLTAAAPFLMSCPDHHANSGACKVPADRNLNGQTDNVLQGKVMHGELSDNHRTARNKDHSNISMKNQKRRAEFFKLKGGSESAISDLQVPSLSPSSSSWSWDREEDRRRQEKWQEEQERLLQKQYQLDQERLESEWQRAQQDAKGESCRKPGAKQNTLEMTNGVESPASTQRRVNGLQNKTREEPSPDQEKLKVAGSDPQSNASGEQRDKISGQVWAEDSFGFAQLSPAHRAKSLSTPALAGNYKQTTGDERKGKGPSVCKAEKNRQQILEEMKKRTQLLTDNSWIRQRSNSFYKEPIYVGVSMKRFDSLDDLDTLRQTPLSTSTFSYPRPHSAAEGYCAPSRNSSSRYSTGSLLSQRPTFESFHHGRMVCGRRTCCVCERVLGSGAAMVIEALGLCFHLACFQCVGCHRHLGGTETGVQVRIRNGKPYCEPCYFQLKSGAPSI